MSSGGGSHHFIYSSLPSNAIFMPPFHLPATSTGSSALPLSPANVLLPNPISPFILVPSCTPRQSEFHLRPERSLFSARPIVYAARHPCRLMLWGIDRI